VTRGDPLHPVEQAFPFVPRLPESEILASPDDLKLRSCATLLAAISPARSVSSRCSLKTTRVRRTTRRCVCSMDAIDGCGRIRRRCLSQRAHAGGLSLPRRPRTALADPPAIGAAAHGVKYMFPVHRGEITRGLPTGYAAPPLNDHIADNGQFPPVWPDPDGETRGFRLDPLHRSVPRAARRDSALYEFLALIDALRDGRVRERRLAEKEISARLERFLRG
jgi:hypothetical protein